MTVSNNYTPLASSGDVYLVDSQQPAGVYLAKMLADGSMDLLTRVGYVEDLQTKVETLTAAVVTYGTEIESLRTKPAATTKTSPKKESNKALSAALSARGKGRKKGAADWPEWTRAKSLLAEGRSIEEAADLA